MTDADAVDVYLHVYDVPAEEVRAFIRTALDLAQAAPTREARMFFASLAKVAVAELRRRDEEPDTPGRPVAIRVPAAVGEYGLRLMERVNRALDLPGRRHAGDN